MQLLQNGVMSISSFMKIRHIIPTLSRRPDITKIVIENKVNVKKTGIVPLD
jgi:hypothetical protein